MTGFFVKNRERKQTDVGEPANGNGQFQNTCEGKTVLFATMHNFVEPPADVGFYFSFYRFFLFPCENVCKKSISMLKTRAIFVSSKEGFFDSR